MRTFFALLFAIALTGPADALGLMRNPGSGDFGYTGGGGFAGGSSNPIQPGPPNVNWVATANYLGNANPTDTTTGVSIGSPAANRQVLICTSAYGSTAVTAITVGGVSASSVYTDSDYSALWQAAVPTGSTATIATTFSGNTGSIQIMVGAFYSATPAAASTAHLPAGGYAGPPWATTSALTIPAGGIGVVCASPASTQSFTLTGGAIDYSTVVGGAINFILGHNTGSPSSWTPSFSGTAGGIGWSISAGSWGP